MILPACLVFLAGCTMSPDDFEAFCRDHYRITVYDAQQWQRYKTLLIEDAHQGGQPARFDDRDPFDLQGSLGAEHSILFPKPVPLTYRVMLDGSLIARIDDFSAYISDRPDDVPSSCDRFERHSPKSQ